MELRPPEFEPMFRPGTRYRWRDSPEGVIEVVDGGMLQLATGRLVACDPFWGSAIERQCDAFTVTVAPGRYPVTLSGVRWDPALHPRVLPPIPRVGAAKLTIRDEPPVTWELALRPGEDPATLQPGEFFGFGVDSGKGCFLDASAVAAMSRFTVTGSPEDFKLFRDLREWAVANVVVDRGLGLNAVLFDCGMGDGDYPTWIGRTPAGDPACFVADLELLSESLGPTSD
jgi:hypothetical protein